MYREVLRKPILIWNKEFKMYSVIKKVKNLKNKNDKKKN